MSGKISNDLIERGNKMLHNALGNFMVEIPISRIDEMRDNLEKAETRIANLLSLLKWRRDRARRLFRHFRLRMKAENQQLRNKVTQLEERERQFWELLPSLYDIETKEELEEKTKQHNPKNSLVVALCHIWKRDPKVSQLEADKARLRKTLDKAIEMYQSTKQGKECNKCNNFPCRCIGDILKAYIING